jgi:hypothetical protein
MKTLLDTSYAQVSNFPSQMERVIKFLVTQPQTILTPAQLQSVWNTRLITSSHISSIFDQMLRKGQLSHFATLDLGQLATGMSIPDALSWTNITIDLKYAQNSQVLNSLTFVKDKILINGTSYLQLNSSGHYVTKDAAELHSMYVRGQLCRSYAERGHIWCNAAITLYLIETYGICISGMLTQRMGLSGDAQIYLARLFGLYMAQKLSSPNSTQYPDIFLRCTSLGNQKELDEFQKSIFANGVTQLTLGTLCEILSQSDISTLNGFTVGKFYAFVSSLGPISDPVSTRIAFEYPPYWMFLILRALDTLRGAQLGNMLKRYRLDGDRAKKVIRDIESYEGLYRLNH